MLCCYLFHEYCNRVQARSGPELRENNAVGDEASEMKVYDFFATIWIGPLTSSGPERERAVVASLSGFVPRLRSILKSTRVAAYIHRGDLVLPRGVTTCNDNGLPLTAL